MRRRSRQGASAIEFAFSLLFLIPLFLGLTGIGISMLRQLQTVQLARDAGAMSARKVDFTLLGSQQILNRVAGSLGLTVTTGSGGSSNTAGVAGAGNAVVILSTIQYVTAGVCTSGGYTYPPGTCTNYQNWVFTKRVVVGNNTLRTSNLGTPTGLTTAIDSTGAIALADQCTTAGDRVTGTNPWTSSTIAADALAVIQVQPIYVSEAAAVGFRLPPFSSGTTVYAQLYF
jgi:Flp pilus assembly protein TadG